MGSYRVISSDNHVFEPQDLWTSRVEPKFRDRAPRVVRLDNGDDWWFCDNKKVIHMAAGTQTGIRFDEPDKLSNQGTFDQVRLGGYIPEEHMKDMDADGVDVSVVYPTFGLLIYGVPDSELLTSLFSTYNDWLAEFCKPFPKRLKGIAMINVDEPREAVKELERCAKMGLAGGMITVYPPEEKGYFSPEYEPLWAAAQDLEMPLGLHLATNRPGPGQEFADLDTVRPAFIANGDHWIRMSLGHMVLSGVFERYPKLQIGSVEHELSWVPHFLDRLDYTYTQRAPQQGGTLDAPLGDIWYRFKEDMLPSDYVHRNVFFGFQEDSLGIRLRDVIGVDNLMWGSDYPHQESTFPKSMQVLEEILADCTEEEKAKIAGGNCARIYHFD